ncbi:actin-like protein 2/3 complex subunit 4 [Puccinia sorghi]|uniref:Actin-like protein 2/3 complex subunit 4 n=1 Tax=Puccinia sorghi TaxID=27349 RepID=A0A0L6VNH6_9BASI|nr:actin-like protein 2/3 complex subunit 4 [Puccinia sorghi]
MRQPRLLLRINRRKTIPRTTQVTQSTQLPWKTPEVLMTPLYISRTPSEFVLIEPSINSVRLSIKIKQADDIEQILYLNNPDTAKLLARGVTRFLSLRAENFIILRRKPIKSFDISFLITSRNIESMIRLKVVDFIIQFSLPSIYFVDYRNYNCSRISRPISFLFSYYIYIYFLSYRFMEDVDREISEMKLSLNARARIVAESYLTQVKYLTSFSFLFSLTVHQYQN